MRKIKYRAWDKVNKKMVNVECITGMVREEFLTTIITDEGVQLVEGDFILMQYTGLSDKNGNEICEGDICIGKRGGSSYAFEVKWDEIDARFLGYTSSGYICYVGQEPSVEVIDNIYENPELIKE